MSVTNSLATKFPAIASEMNRARTGYAPSDFTAFSGTRVWWTCGSGHSYDMSIAARTKSGYGCPICSRKRITRENGLAVLYPHLLAEWHPTKNKDIDPALVPADSPHHQYWWQCSADPNHEWQATSQHRASRGFGCPYCSGQIVTDRNRLSIRRPDIAAQVDEERTGIRAADLHVSSGKRVYWRCQVHDEHHWVATVGSRTGRAGAGCPFCSGKRAWSGHNLAAAHPVVAQEFAHDLNPGLVASGLTPASGKRVSWRCILDASHIWQATVASRTRAFQGCPHCTKGRRTSIREIALRKALQLAVPDAGEGVIAELGRQMNVDILVPSLRLAVEYDGAYYHRDREERDRAKCAAAAEHGWTMIRVREAPLPLLGPLDVACTYREPAAHVGLRVIQTLRERWPSIEIPTDEALAEIEQDARTEYAELKKTAAHRKAFSTKASEAR